jgi:hypothetical protein
MASFTPASQRYVRYFAVTRWFAVDALRAHPWRIVASAVAELLGFAFKVGSLGLLLILARKLQFGESWRVMGQAWPADSGEAAFAAACLVALGFFLGGALAFFARGLAIDVVSASSARWLRLAVGVVRQGYYGPPGPKAVRAAALAGQDALAAGRVLWQLLRGSASFITGIWLAVGMFWLEPFLTSVVLVTGISGLFWQFRASIRGAQGTRELERASASMRHAWVREVSNVAKGIPPKDPMPSAFGRVISSRADQLRVIEQSGLSASSVMAVLIGGVALYFALESSRMAGRWDIVIAYVISIRALAGILDSVARRIVAVHRLYPNLSRFWQTAVARTPLPERAPGEAGTDGEVPEAQFDNVEA